MSIDIMSQVWKHSPITDARQLLALLALADWADEYGGCYPSYDTIKKKIRVRQRQHSINVVKALIKAGEIFKVGKDGNFDSNLFVVLSGVNDPETIKKRVVKSAEARGIKMVPDIDARVLEVLRLRHLFAGIPDNTSMPQDTPPSMPQHTTPSTLGNTPPVQPTIPNPSLNHHTDTSVDTSTSTTSANAESGIDNPTLFDLPPVKEKGRGRKKGSADEPPPAPTRRKTELTEEQSARRIQIIEAYADELGYPVPTREGGRMGKAASNITLAGYNPEQVVNCYRNMKKQPFWAKQFLRLENIETQIGEYLKNPNGTTLESAATLPGTRPQTEAEIQAMYDDAREQLRATGVPEDQLERMLA